MDAEDFVTGVRTAVFESSIKATLATVGEPVGKAPTEERLDLAEWYNGLGDADSARARELVRLAADQAVFGMLAVLDGVRTVHNSHPALVLHADGVPLNPDGELHELWQIAIDTDSL
jgi:hypothetical protein